MKHIYLFIFSVLLSTATFSQNTLELQAGDLVIPSSPAFSLLDANPKVIERPGTIKALALNLVNNAGESAGIPKNFALEFAPYWLFKNKKMNIYKYNGIRLNEEDEFKSQNIFANIRSTSLSAGSLFKDSGSALPLDVNYFAYGIRSNIINVRNKKVLKAMTERMLSINESLGEAIRQSYCATLPAGQSELECYSNALKRLLKSDSALTAMRNEYQVLTELRPFLSVDLALSSSIAFGNNTFSNSKNYRSGGWITLAISQPFAKADSLDALINNKNYANLYVMARSITENRTDDFIQFTKHNVFDIGGRFELELDRFAVSFESIHRFYKNNKELNGSRNVGIIQYKVTNSLYLVGTFGKNFEKVKNLVALIGLNFGFGGNSLFQKM